jgi:3-hydroxyisobutyrate dehydrogenase-like beta-hydroxyacid dehydrogenase
MSSIKARSTSADDADAPRKFERAQGTPAWEKPIVGGSGEAQNAKLKQMLAGLKKVD